jgi:hypothetical protein
VANNFIVNFVLGAARCFRFDFLNNQVGVFIYSSRLRGVLGISRAWAII